MTLSYASSLLHEAVTPIYIWAPPPCNHKHHHHMKPSRIMAGLGMNGRSTIRFASDLKAYLYLSPNPGNEGLDQHGVDMASYSKFSLKLPTYIIVQNAIFGARFWIWEWKSGKVLWGNVEAHMMKILEHFSLSSSDKCGVRNIVWSPCCCMGHMEVQICMETDPMHMLPTAAPPGDMGVPRHKVKPYTFFAWFSGPTNLPTIYIF